MSHTKEVIMKLEELGPKALTDDEIVFCHLMRVKAIPMKGSDLKPGDLFSSVGPEYWNEVEVKYNIGEKVYIRTNADSSFAPDFNELIYKIEIIKG